MRSALKFVAASVVSLSFGAAAFADPAGKDVEPLMTKRGQQVLADDFSKPELGSQWKVAKGKWEVVDGALKGTEVAADMHAAVIRADLKHTDAIYQFDFKFVAGKQTSLSINGAKGHICRVVITPGGFSVNKDGTKDDDKDKAVRMDSCKIAFEPGKWHTMTVEVCGKEMLARVDDKHFAFGQEDKVASEKANFGFPVGGDGVLFDNVKVWQASPNPQWPEVKSKLSAEHPEKLPTPKPAGKAKDAKVTEAK